jgi:glyoxylate reductase/D-3-phosphoglycerate dehydrogenase
MINTLFFTFLDRELAAQITAAAPPEFQVETYPIDLPDAEKIPLVATADFLILFPGSLSAEVLRVAPQLKLIQLLSAGYELMDLSLCAELGVPVANNGGTNAIDVAEHTLALILGLYRRLTDQDRGLRAGDWDAVDNGRDTYTIHGKTAALVGMGHIGRHVALRLKAFGADLLYVDSQPAPAELTAELSLERVDLSEALARADILSLHVPLLPQTRGLIGTAELAQMRPTALLINTCRGPVVDETALIAALREQQILGAGLDVFEREPLAPDHPLLNMPNALLTPHAAGITHDTWSRRGAFAFANLRRVWAGAKPLSQIGAS